MRDILFRGKLPRGEWLYGVPIKRKGDEVLLYTPFDDMHIVMADTEDGAEVACLKDAKLDFTECVEEAEDHRGIKNITELPEITFKLKLPKKLRCKSRKRLIKLLMSIGYQRNCAEFVALICRSIGVPYSKAWEFLCLSNDGNDTDKR